MVAILTILGVIVGITVGAIQLLDRFRNLRERRRSAAAASVIDVKAVIETRPEAWADDSEDWRGELLRPGASTDLERQKQRIAAVLGGEQFVDVERNLAAWHKYLRRTLVFPFQVRRRAGMDQPSIELTARRLIGVRGGEIIAQVARGIAVEELPLDSLVGKDTGTRNHECLEDYAIWRRDRT
jgi:hypothetical protein